MNSKSQTQKASKNVECCQKKNSFKGKKLDNNKIEIRNELNENMQPEGKIEKTKSLDNSSNSSLLLEEYLNNLSTGEVQEDENDEILNGKSNQRSYLEKSKKNGNSCRIGIQENTATTIDNNIYAGQQFNNLKNNEMFKIHSNPLYNNDFYFRMKSLNERKESQENKSAIYRNDVNDSRYCESKNLSEYDNHFNNSNTFYMNENNIVSSNSYNYQKNFQAKEMGPYNNFEYQQNFTMNELYYNVSSKVNNVNRNVNINVNNNVNNGAYQLNNNNFYNCNLNPYFHYNFHINNVNNTNMCFPMFNLNKGNDMLYDNIQFKSNFDMKSYLNNGLSPSNKGYSKINPATVSYNRRGDLDHGYSNKFNKVRGNKLS